MRASRPRHEPCMEVDAGSPLIGIIMDHDGREVVRYFSTEEEAEADTPPEVIEATLALAGVWSDLDWADMERELDRIRHANPPSPPISQ